VNNRTAKALGATSTLAMVLGFGYILDCRRDPTAKRPECWLTGGLSMGVGGAFKAGYWTPNPDLATARRKRRTEPTESVE
jgi:hypothetical protein